MKTIFRFAIITALLVASFGFAVFPASANTKETFTTVLYFYNENAGYCSNGQHIVEEDWTPVVTTIHRTTSGEVFMQEEDVTMIGGFYIREDPSKRLDWENSH